MSLRDLVTSGGTDSVLGSVSVAAAPKGVYATYPGYTTKYGQRGPDYQQNDVARLYVELNTADERNRFKQNVETYLKSAGEDAQEISMGVVGLKSSIAYGYVDFFLTSINMPSAEKYQVNEVIGDSYVAYFFGREPPIWTLSGTLLDTRQDDWALAFHVLYDAVMRGTRMAELGKVVALRFNQRIVKGVFLGMTQTSEATMQMATGFNAAFLVKEYIILLERGRRSTALSTERVASLGIRQDGVLVVENTSPVQIQTEVIREVAVAE